MANYYCAVRTNYFAVKDGEAFEKFMAGVSGEDSVHVWKEPQKDGSVKYGFGCDGSISGWFSENDNEDDWDVAMEKFEAGLMEHVAEGDAVIIMESGHEKLRYITGYATIITSDGVDGINLVDAAIQKAREMLGSPEWDSQCEY